MEAVAARLQGGRSGEQHIRRRFQTRTQDLDDLAALLDGEAGILMVHGSVEADIEGAAATADHRIGFGRRVQDAQFLGSGDSG